MTPMTRRTGEDIVSPDPPVTPQSHPCELQFFLAPADQSKRETDQNDILQVLTGARCCGMTHSSTFHHFCPQVTDGTVIHSPMTS